MGLLMRVEAAAVIAVIAVTLALAPGGARAKLSSSYYAQTCPGLEYNVNDVLQSALMNDSRIGASLLRMHFHDCFVQGCDASITLVDTPTFTGEQTAKPNVNSIRGFDILEQIKARVESICPGVVSCADILALVARDAVISAYGPFWEVKYGRRDSTTACLSCANTQIPSPFGNVTSLTAFFAAKGLDQKDMTALSGAHTFGKAHCGLFSGRLTNFSGTGAPDPTLNPTYRSTLLQKCPQGVSTSVVVHLDLTTPFVFDNAYYTNLFNDDGLLTSDQTLYSEGGPTATIVTDYGSTQKKFFKQFAKSILKMGEITPLTGSQGEIRKVCSFVN
ncbi:unnamed protein product [Calypogeia fissa]